MTRKIVPVLVTLIAVLIATVAGWGAWTAYLRPPWTRDGTVRAYVVVMAPEVAGRIVGLPVKDNDFVQKGQILETIDPTDYAIAVSNADAALKEAQAGARNLDIEARRRAQLTTLAASQEEQQTYESTRWRRTRKWNRRRRNWHRPR